MNPTHYESIIVAWAIHYTLSLHFFLFVFLYDEMSGKLIPACYYVLWSIPQDQKHVNKGARNWTPIETNQFCLISADSVNQFMITLERKARKKSLIK